MTLSLVNLSNIVGILIGFVVFELYFWNINSQTTLVSNANVKLELNHSVHGEWFSSIPEGAQLGVERFIENITKGTSKGETNSLVGNKITGATDKKEDGIIHGGQDPVTRRHGVTNTTQDRLLSDKLQGDDTDKVNSSYKSVLFWNSYFGIADYGVGFGSEALKRHKCSVYQCSFTANRSELDVADAVVVHGFLIGENDMPKRTSSKQIFLYFMYENPLLTKKLMDLSYMNNMFNLTFSYLDHPDTDIFITNYGKVKRDIPDPEAIPSINIMKSKTRHILWIVSNCHPLSARVEYAKKLSEYIPVDIYGACGNLSCPDGSHRNNPGCIAMLSKQYRFYLSFENSFCQDYYTEKIWNPLRHNIIPITMGQANYSKYLPPNSYIDVRDFESPRQLADRLIYLQDHPDEYIEYFQWRKDYSVHVGFRKLGFCKVCEILHTDNYAYKSEFKIDQYWNPDQLCLNKTEHMNMLHIE